MGRKIHSMKPADRTAHLGKFVGQWGLVVYGKHYQRDARCQIVAVAPSLSSSISDQLVVKSYHGGGHFVISTAEIISFEED